MKPEEFAKDFAGAFGRQDAAALAAMLTEDADVLTLTGGVAETASEAETLFADEFAGIFASARLVTGKARMRALGPGAAVINQRFVVSGAKDETGQDLPRFGAVLTVVIIARMDGWHVVSLTFSATA